MQGDRLGEVEGRQGDAHILAQLLRADLLPEAWIARRQCVSCLAMIDAIQVPIDRLVEVRERT